MGYLQSVQTPARGGLTGLHNRWAVLALLFSARTVMAMQFQIVGTLSPALEARYSISQADIGLAIGLYFAPGVLFALPGGAIGARFGERQVSALALWLMAIGGAVMASADGWHLFLAGQLLAGAGGVIVNVLMTKMVVEWFEDGGVATALSIFINSWPLGIALSLVLLPPVAGASGVAGATAFVAALSFVLGAMVFCLYRSPTNGNAMPQKGWLGRRDFTLAVSSGLIWGGFNAGMAVVFGFGTALINDAGATPAVAARQVSLVLWSLAIVAPLGGWLSDRQKHPEIMIAVGLIFLAALTVFAGLQGGAWPLLVLLGAAAGLVAGPVMSLPARSLSAEGRSAGMGLFFTMYYVAFLLTPPIAGWAADVQGSLVGAFVVGCAMQGLAMAALLFFARKNRRTA